MPTEPLRRNHRLRLDAVTSRAFSSLSSREARAAFGQLLAIARSRSDVVRPSITRTNPAPRIEALRNLAAMHQEFLRSPRTWPGAAGHPLHVVQSLASHLLARHPTPRFLASAWFGAEQPRDRERRAWFIAHAQGARFRSLALPMPMTRRMEHLFLQTPDHCSIDHALRRAEVMALGGSEDLASSVVATRLGRSFDHPELWRSAIEWMVRWAPQLGAAQIGPIVDYVHAVRFATTLVDTPEGQRVRPPPRPDFELRGRTATSLLRDVAAWHAGLTSAARLRWAASRWRPLFYEAGAPDEEGRRVEWSLLEFLDSAQLVQEGQAMRHCVAAYAPRCARGASAIWSLRRRRGADGAARPVLTIEVDPRRSTVVQIRGPTNRRASGWPLEIVRAWAARERLGFSPLLEAELAAA